MQNLLQKIIKEEIRKILNEEGEVPTLPDPSQNTSNPSSLPPSSSDVNSGGTTPPATQVPGQPMALDNSGGTPAAPPGSPGTPSQSPGMPMDSGTPGMPSDGVTNPAEAPVDDGSVDVTSDDSSMQDETAEDPQEKLLTTAKDIIDKTNNTQKTLKALKNLIQANYEDPKEANQFVFDLSNNEQDPRLKDVARRLFLYLTGR